MEQTKPGVDMGQNNGGEREELAPVKDPNHPTWMEECRIALALNAGAHSQKECDNLKANLEMSDLWAKPLYEEKPKSYNFSKD